MSKKAEELAVEITGLSPKSYDVGSKIRAEAQTRLDRVTTRIDDFARKERERAAERFRKKYFSLVATEEYEDDEIADMWNLYITEHCCSAILSPEEN
jgi:hypothetical protein